MNVEAQGADETKKDLYAFPHQVPFTKLAVNLSVQAGLFVC